MFVKVILYKPYGLDDKYDSGVELWLLWLAKNQDVVQMLLLQCERDCNINEYETARGRSGLVMGTSDSIPGTIEVAHPPTSGQVQYQTIKITDYAIRNVWWQGKAHINDDRHINEFYEENAIRIIF